MKTATESKPSLIVQRTNKLIADQGFTYNEAGKTYNEIGMIYGGIYGQDILQITSAAKLQSPTNTSVSDLPNTLAIKTYLRGSPMGLLHDLTFNQTITVFI